MPYITPSNLPVDTFCRQILIPNSPEWIGAVSGALMSLMFASEWEQVDGITADEAAARWSQMMREYWASNCSGGDGMPCEGSCPEVLRRVNPDTLQLEISTNNGVTWRSDPASPVSQIYAQPAPVTSGVSATKCDAASNGKQHIEDLIAGCSTQLGTAINVFDLAVAVCAIVLEIALVLVSAGSLTPLAIALASAVWAAAHAAFEIGKEAFDAYWTTDEKDKILCALYCNIGEDGSFDQTQYDNFMSDWKEAATPSPAYNFVRNALLAVGLKGLNNFCSYGESSEADCSGCSCGCPNKDLYDIFVNAGEAWGTIVDSGDDYITVEASNIPTLTGYVASLLSADYTQGCVISTEILSGTQNSAICWIDTGNNPASVSPTCSVWVSHSVIFIQMTSTVPFTVKFTFS